MNELKSQNSARPGSLGSPVPGANQQNSADQFLSSLKMPPPKAGQTPQPSGSPAPSAAAPEPPQSDTPPQGDAADQFISSLNQGGAAPSADQFAPEPGFVQANIDQFNPRNFIDRLQTGLAANDTEKVNFLKQKYGDGNVTQKDGKIYYRRDAKDKLKPLDPATLELVSDIIPDFAREGVTEAAMIPGEVAGTLAGTVAGAAGGIPGMIAGGAAGARIGRIASVPVANYAVDKLAEAVGIPHDDGRSAAMEDATGMAAEALLPIAGKALLKRLPGTEAYNAAKQAGQREIVALSKQSEEVAGSVARLQEIGRAATVDGSAVGIPGANVPLMGHMLNPDSPLAQKYAAVAASDPRFINAQNQLAEDWGNSLTNTLTEIAKRNNKGLVPPERLAQTVTNAVDDAGKAEGAAIGKFRAQAMAKLGGAKQPLPDEVNQQVQTLLQDLGFKPRQVMNETLQRRSVTDLSGEGDQFLYKKVSNPRTVWSPPADIRPIIGKYGITSPGEARALVNNVQQLSKGLDGGLPLAEIDRLRNQLGSAGSSMGGTQAGGVLSKLSGSLRQQYRDVIGGALENPVDKQAFNQTMDDFGVIRQNVDVLRGALNEDSSAKAIVKKFFTGPENLQKIQAIKSLSPDSGAALKSEFVSQLLTDYASRDSKTGFNSKAFLDGINKKYGSQFLSEVLDDGPGPNLQTVKDILTVTERIENQFKNVKVDSLGDEQKRGLVNAAIGAFTNMRGRAVDGLKNAFAGRGGTDNALVQILTNDGIAKYVADYPGRVDKQGATQFLSDLVAQSKLKNVIQDPRVQRAVRRKAVDETMDTIGGRADQVPQ